ncbi:MAG: hypothetical protein RLZZ360_794 [Candidatus Parcubacteria bacterium]|jgi:hypothetical protein
MDRRITRKDFQDQADANVGVTWADSDAQKALFDAIKKDDVASALGKRVVMWMVEAASLKLSTPVEVSFYYDVWGRDLACEIQHDADTLSGGRMRQLWLDCGVGRHLTHHTGGRDNLLRWNSNVRASTLWIAEGDDWYNHKDKALVVTPNLAEIGAFPLLHPH